MSDAKVKTRFQFHWTRRANEERSKRIESEEQLAQVMDDWEEIMSTSAAVEKEIRLNNWTSTAKLLFSGRDTK